jgi:hypothetical protein
VQPVLDDLYPLSPMQEGLLFHSLESPESGVHIVQHAWILRQPKVDALTRAWNWVLQRHAILRTAFVWKRTSRPLQAVIRDVQLPLTVDEWSDAAPEERAERLREYLHRDRGCGFDVSRAPLLRAALMRLDEHRYQFVLTQHHILLDGWSLPLLWNDVAMAYHAYGQNREPSLPPPHPFRDYIAWLQRQDLDEATQFWRRLLGDFAGQRLTPPSPPLAATGAASVLERSVWLSRDATRRLIAWCRAHQLTVNTVVQGVWPLILSELRHTDDVVFGAIVAGRPADLPGAETMLGLFINTLPVRVRVRTSDTIVTWLRNIQRQHSEASQYAYTPLPHIKRTSSVPAHEALFDTAINFVSYPRPRPAEPSELELPEIDEAIYRTLNSYPLSLLVTARGDGLSLLMLANPQQFASATVERIAVMLEALLSSWTHEADATIADLQRTLQGATRTLLVSRRGASLHAFRVARSRQATTC